MCHVESEELQAKNTIWRSETRMLNPDLRTTRDGANEPEPDVRDIIDYADKIGELAHLDGADWNVEIGVLAEIFAHSNPGRSPAVLFDKIKGYPAGMRIVSGLHNSCRRLAYAFGFPDSEEPTSLVKAYRDRMKGDFRLIPPVEVTAKGTIELRDAVGFGYDLDHEYLESLVVRREELF